MFWRELRHTLNRGEAVHAVQRAVERIEAVGGEKLSSEDLRRIAPMNLERINLRGTFEFPLTGYAGRILPSSILIIMPASLKHTR